MVLKRGSTSLFEFLGSRRKIRERFSPLLVAAVGCNGTLLKPMSESLNRQHMRIYSPGRRDYGGGGGGVANSKYRGWVRYAVGRPSAAREDKFRNWELACRIPNIFESCLVETRAHSRLYVVFGNRRLKGMPSRHDIRNSELCNS